MEWCNKANLQLLLAVGKLGKKWTSISKYISASCISINEDEKSKFEPQKCSVQYNYLLETTRQASGDNENLPENELLEKAKLHYLVLRKQEICDELSELDEKEILKIQEKELISKGQYSKLGQDTIQYIRKYCRAHNLPDHLGTLLNLPPLLQNAKEDATLLLEENRNASLDNCLAEATRIWTEETYGQNLDEADEDEWIPINEEEYRQLIEWQPCHVAARYPHKRAYRHEKTKDNDSYKFSMKRKLNFSQLREEPSLETILCKPVIHWSEIERCTGKTNPWNLDPSYSESASQESIADLCVPLRAITGKDCDEPLEKLARSSNREDLLHSISDPACQSETGMDYSCKILTVPDSPASSSASGGAIMALSSSSNNHPVKLLTSNRTKMDRGMRQSNSRARGRSRCEDSPLTDSNKFNRSQSVFIGSLNSESNVWQVPDNLEFDRKRWRKSIVTALSSIMTHRHSHVFTHPVTDEIAPGYSDIVFRPMDLSTIRRRLDSGEIQTTGQFLRDLLLMFTNARMYNSSSHEVYKMAEEMAADVLDSLLPLWDKSDSKAQGPGLNLRGSNSETSTPAQSQIHKKSQIKLSNRTRQYSSSSETSSVKK